MTIRLLPTVAVALLLFSGCSKKEENLAAMPFSDNFDRSELGDNWYGDPAWRIRDGQVFSAGTNNRPLWLRASIPENAVIEFDARSESPAGDIKVEFYADGTNHESGYILIFGGWKNSISCIARLDEHGADRQEIKKAGQVTISQTHHIKVVRKDKVIKWYLDGKLKLDYYDSEPLKGNKHDRFAFNNWQSHLFFDNLKIRAATQDD